MKILITGAGGWLGSELTERLLEEGNYIRALVLYKSNRLVQLKERYKNLEIIEGDICNKEAVNNSLEGMEVVYHLAAKVHSLPKNKKDEEEFYKINTYATEQLFNLCIEHNIQRVIFYSSVSVYGEYDEVIDINTIKKPVTPYAKSKLMAEEIGLKLYQEKGLPITIIEPVTVYGGDDAGNFEKLRKLMQKGLMIKFGDGLNKKTIIYYKDLISMTLKISEDSNAVGKVIICGTEVITLNNILDVLYKNCNKKVLIIEINRKLTNILIKILNVANIKVTKNIARQINVISSHSEYSYIDSKGYFGKNKKFVEYYNN